MKLSEINSDREIELSQLEEEPDMDVFSHMLMQGARVMFHGYPIEPLVKLARHVLAHQIDMQESKMKKGTVSDLDKYVRKVIYDIERKRCYVTEIVRYNTTVAPFKVTFHAATELKVIPFASVASLTHDQLDLSQHVMAWDSK